MIVGMRFTDSIMLRAIINSVSKRDPIWFSMLPVVGLFGIGFSRKLITTRRDFSSLMAYLSVRLVLINALFDKVIHLSEFEAILDEIVGLEAVFGSPVANFGGSDSQHGDYGRCQGPSLLVPTQRLRLLPAHGEFHESHMVLFPVTDLRCDWRTLLSDRVEHTLRRSSPCALHPHELLHDESPV